jgi:hypothetical protein
VRHQRIQKDFVKKNAGVKVRILPAEKKWFIFTNCKFIMYKQEIMKIYVQKAAKASKFNYQSNLKTIKNLIKNGEKKFLVK